MTFGGYLCGKLDHRSASCELEACLIREYNSVGIKKGSAMKTVMLLAAMALMGSAAAPASACDYTHTTAAQNSTVVACADGKCETKAPATQQDTGRN
jgi:hypothetical protein